MLCSLGETVSTFLEERNVFIFLRAVSNPTKKATTSDEYPIGSCRQYVTPKGRKISATLFGVTSYNTYNPL